MNDLASNRRASNDRRTRYRHRRRLAAGSAGLVGLALIATPLAAAASPAAPAPTSFLSHLSAVTNVASTVPVNGDLNPYGIAVVSQSEGRLVAGDTLVRKFNDAANLQGTGSTIVEVSPSGAVSTFAQLSASSRSGPSGVGLTTALTILPGGWVVVGNLPTSD